MIGGSSSSSAAFVLPVGAVSSRLSKHKVFQIAELSQGNRAAVVGRTSSEVPALEKVNWNWLCESVVVKKMLERMHK